MKIKPFILALIPLIIIFVIVRFSLQEKAQSTTYLDYKTITYTVEGKPLTLGKDSSLQYFGNEVTHDLNDDGREDIAFIVTHSPGGTGTFYYVVAALNTKEGYIASDGFLLGDRIAPQPLTIDEGMTSVGTTRNNIIVANYATRLPSEPFTATPTINESKWIRLDPLTMKLGEVAINFEGEAR